MGKTVNLRGYFERIGFAGSIAPTVATLDLLHALHPAAIPFENLDPLLGTPVSLDLEAIERKLVSARRGGYCYEHNLLFMAVLQELEFTVRPLGARVLWNTGEARDTKATHMLLAVEIGGTTYLADPGFGGLALTAPLKLRAESEQITPHETYRLTGGDPHWRLEARLGEEWRPLYSFDLAEQTPEDYAAANSFVGSDPLSPFTRELRVALSPSGRRLTLRDNRFTVHADGEPAQIRFLATADDFREVLSGPFGITLPDDPRLDDIFAAILARSPLEG